MATPKKPSALTLETRITRQRKKLETLEEQLGYLMSKRALEEEKLADLLKQAASLQGES